MKCSLWHQRCVYSGTGTATGWDKARHLKLCFWKLFFSLWKDLRGIFTSFFHIQIAVLLLFSLWLMWIFKYSGPKGDKHRSKGSRCGFKLHEESIQELPSYNHRILECLAWRGHLPLQPGLPQITKPIPSTSLPPENPPAFAHPQQMSVMDITGNFHCARQMQLNCQNQHWILAWAAIKAEQCRYLEPAFNHSPSPVLIS